MPGQHIHLPPGRVEADATNGGATGAVLLVGTKGIAFALGTSISSAAARQLCRDQHREPLEKTIPYRSRSHVARKGLTLGI